MEHAGGFVPWLMEPELDIRIDYAYFVQILHPRRRSGSCYPKEPVPLQVLHSRSPPQKAHSRFVLSTTPYPVPSTFPVP
jgi:hypothetical protein